MVGKLRRTLHIDIAAQKHHEDLDITAMPTSLRHGSLQSEFLIFVNSVWQSQKILHPHVDTRYTEAAITQSYVSRASYLYTAKNHHDIRGDAMLLKGNANDVHNIPLADCTYR